MNQETGVSESRFNMWRCVVAMAHADGVVTPHELSFINDYVKEIDFNKDHLKTIGDDLLNPKDIHELFLRVTDKQDKVDFFALARALSWSDGDYDIQEKKIIKQLEIANSIDEEMLRESREIVNEVELNNNQWEFKTERSLNLFGFLNRKAA